MASPGWYVHGMSGEPTRASSRSRLSWAGGFAIAMSVACSARDEAAGPLDASKGSSGVEGGSVSADGSDPGVHRDASVGDDGGGPADAGPSDGASDGAAAGNGAHGTWVLALQESDRAAVDTTFGTVPGLVGISARFTWAGLAANMPAALDYWRAAADALGDGGPPPRLAIRFMAGRNTPSTSSLTPRFS